MAIWFDPLLSVAQLQPLGRDTMGDLLGMEFTEVGDNYLKARMPVDNRTRQPFGLLHGGASAALAETLGSVASHFVVNPDKFYCVGLEINANHVRGVKEGFVYGTVSPLHIGASTHVWDIRIVDERDKLVCVSRLTVAVLKR
jgi:1,4-dihydroxy-2-naphthoyl-CoA hydrolase